MGALAVTLSRGQTAYIDAECAGLVAGAKWYAVEQSNKSGKFYAMRPGGGKPVYMHRIIINAADGEVVDHVDGDPLNNRRANLRLTTQRLNLVNRHYPSGSGYRGVHRSRKKWLAQIEANGERWTTGVFDAPEAAARAYDDQARILYGDFATLNFPDEPSRQPDGWRCVKGRNRG